MADFDRLIMKKGTCCICGRPMSDSKFISLAQLDKKAAWKYPVWNNVLIPGLEDRAVAIMCDGCHEASEISGVSGMIKYAVEIRGEEIILHDIEDLEDVPPLQQIVKPTDNPEEIPDIPDFFTGSVNDQRYGPLLQPRDRPRFWMDETSGRMKGIVIKFLNKEPLSGPDLEILRRYVHQWVAAMIIKPCYYDKILKFTQEELSDYVSGELMEYGIDPF